MLEMLGFAHVLHRLGLKGRTGAEDAELGWLSVASFQKAKIIKWLKNQKLKIQTSRLQTGNGETEANKLGSASDRIGQDLVDLRYKLQFILHQSPFSHFRKNLIFLILFEYLVFIGFNYKRANSAWASRYAVCCVHFRELDRLLI